MASAPREFRHCRGDCENPRHWSERPRLRLVEPVVSDKAVIAVEAPPVERRNGRSKLARTLSGRHGRTEARSPIRALIVEDDASVRDLLDLVLTSRGHQVTAFDTAEEAWERCQHEDFQLLILDWLLPGVDGLELCRRVRALPRASSSVILVATGRDAPEDLEAILGAGANDYIGKPFDLAAFEVRLRIAEQQIDNIEERRRIDLLENDRNQVLELIAKNEPLGEVLTHLARLVERQRPDLFCSVRLVREDQLFHEAAPGLSEGFLTETRALQIGPASASCGTAAFRAELVVVNDIATDPLWDQHRATALEHGLRACWSAPICSGSGQVLGTTALYAAEPRDPTREDLDLLETASRLAALAIEHARLFDEAATAEALRSLTRLKSEFLSTASHELRTPLSLVYGYAELLMVRASKLSSTRIAEMAAEIHTGSRTMMRLVDDLLDFSRIEQGRLKLQKRHVQVSDMLSHLAKQFREQPGGERISDDLPRGLEAHVDPERLMQIVSNLLSNALRYASEGQILLRAARRGDWLRIEVADHGPGIPHAEQGRIWEKFYRGKSVMNTTTRGSGLGLSVVKHLVELGGGRVGLRSIPGQGTIFWFTIPVQESSSESYPG